jgi:hypothetical protein
MRAWGRRRVGEKGVRERGGGRVESEGVERREKRGGERGRAGKERRQQTNPKSAIQNPK